MSGDVDANDNNLKLPQDLVAKPQKKQSERPIPQTLYDLLEVTCSISQMHKLLKDAKDATGSKEIKLGGATKADYVRNVQLGVEAYAIKESDVLALIQDREESGDQHIFYFRPKNPEAKKYLSNGGKIGSLLLGERLTDGSLPNFKTTEGEYVWADFRTNSIDNQWTAKIYGHQTRIYFRRQDIKQKVIIRYYDMRERRIVCLCHWNGRELELRIGRVGAGGAIDKSPDTMHHREIDRRKSTLLKFLQPADLMSKVVEWNLSSAQRKMLQSVLDERAAGIKIKDSKLPFLPSSVRFRDSAFGSAEFNSQEDTEELSTATERIEAIKAYLKGEKSTCRHLVVQWDHNAAAGRWGEKPLRTVVGGAEINEITISAGVNSSTVDYVTDQLRAYSS